MDNHKYKNYIKNLKKYKIFIKSMNIKYIDIPNLNSNYIPQGFCKVDNYFFIAAYDCHKKTNSIIYLIDKQGKLLKTVILDGKYHCGGIAYHKKTNSIFVTGESDKNNPNKSYINKYSYQDILTKDKIYASNKYCVDTTNSLKSSITSKSSVAYLTINDDELYLGNFTLQKLGIIKKFKLDTNGNIDENNYQTIYNPYKKTQGMCIYNYNDIKYYLFSTSFGQRKDSILYISILNKDKLKTVKKIILPVMSEQINIDIKGTLSIIFESGSSKFKYTKNKITDICFIDFNKIYNKKRGEL